MTDALGWNCALRLIVTPAGIVVTSLKGTAVDVLLDPSTKSEGPVDVAVAAENGATQFALYARSYQQ